MLRALTLAGATDAQVRQVGGEVASAAGAAQRREGGLLGVQRGREGGGEVDVGQVGEGAPRVVGGGDQGCSVFLVGGWEDAGEARQEQEVRSGGSGQPPGRVAPQNCGRGRRGLSGGNEQVQGDTPQLLPCLRAVGTPPTDCRKQPAPRGGGDTFCCPGRAVLSRDGVSEEALTRQQGAGTGPDGACWGHRGVPHQDVQAHGRWEPGVSHSPVAEGAWAGPAGTYLIPGTSQDLGLDPV